MHSDLKFRLHFITLGKVNTHLEKKPVHLASRMWKFPVTPLYLTMPQQLDTCTMSQDNKAPTSPAQNIPTPHPCRQHFKKSIISSRAGSSIPQDLCQKSCLWLKSNERGRLWLCSGVGGCPQTRQKGKCAAAMGLVMMHSSELPSEPGHSLGTQTPQLPSRSPPHPSLQPIPLPCVLCFSISFPISILLPSPCSPPQRLWGSTLGTTFPQGEEAQGDRSHWHLHIVQVGVLGKGSWLDVS